MTKQGQEDQTTMNHVYENGLENTVRLELLQSRLGNARKRQLAVYIRAAARTILPVVGFVAVSGGIAKCNDYLFDNSGLAELITIVTVGTAGWILSTSGAVKDYCWLVSDAIDSIRDANMMIRHYRKQLTELEQ
ncbi:MAG: hypothetical protein AABW49_04085 [Nanoarchaeota archaeon]